MTQSIRKIGQPARWQGWQLTVDSMASPREFVVIDPHGGEIRTHYVDECDLAVGVLTSVTGMAKGVAASLISQQVAKLRSPKADMADRSDRPLR